MNGAADLAFAQGGDDSFDLPPVAVTLDVVGIAAAFRANSRFETCIVAILLEQGRGIGKGAGPGDEERIHAPH